MIDLPSGSLSGCDRGIISSSTACLAPMNPTGCILSVSCATEVEMMVASVQDEVATHFY